jgi:hypothetical protein
MPDEQKEETPQPEAQGALLVPTPAPIRKAALVSRPSGVIVGSTIEEQFRVATAMCDSRMVPKHFDSPQKVWVAMQFALGLGVRNVVAALRNIYIINNAPALWGDLPLGIVRDSGLLESIDEFFLDKDGKRIGFGEGMTQGDPVVAVCQVKRAGEAMHTTWFGVEDARKAGLLSKETYKQYLRRMLKLRARAEALKDRFADVLMGAQIAEYDARGSWDAGGDFVPDAPSEEPQRLSEALNKKFLPEAAAQETQQ